MKVTRYVLDNIKIFFQSTDRFIHVKIVVILVFNVEKTTWLGHIQISYLSDERDEKRENDNIISGSNKRKLK